MPEATPSPSPQSTRTRVAPQVAKVGPAAYVSVQGMIDEHFLGFGDLTDVTTAVIDLQGVTFMTSFGVRQWLKSMAAVPPSVTHLYLMNCPAIIVDQLNMILNFGGPAKVISLAAPFVCSQCNASSRETIDVIAEGAAIQRGEVAPRSCRRCGGALEFDDIIESYFACLKKYGATSIDPAAAQLVATGAKLKKVAVKPSIRAATAPALPSISMPPTVVPPRQTKSIVPVVALIAILLAIAIGVYVLVGPS